MIEREIAGHVRQVFQQYPVVPLIRVVGLRGLSKTLDELDRA